MNLIELAIKGGWIMAVLFILSIISVSLFIERWLVTRKALKIEEKTYIEILRLIDKNKAGEAADICKLSDSPICKILKQGLKYADTDMNLAQETIEQTASQFIKSLEKNITTISTFAAIAPLIGFLGTVTGMIRVFQKLDETAGTAVMQELAGGIWEALTTTVAGLIVGILCIIFHNHLVSKIEAIAFTIDEKITQVTVHLRRIQK